MSQEKSDLRDGLHRPNKEIVDNQPAPGLYYLHRKTDKTGVSGTGYVALVAVFPDNSCATRWSTTYKSTVIWENVQDMLAVHVLCHPDTTELVPVSSREYFDYFDPFGGVYKTEFEQGPSENQKK